MHYFSKGYVISALGNIKYATHEFNWNGYFGGSTCLNVISMKYLMQQNCTIWMETFSNQCKQYIIILWNKFQKLIAAGIHFMLF